MPKGVSHSTSRGFDTFADELAWFNSMEGFFSFATALGLAPVPAPPRADEHRPKAKIAAVIAPKSAMVSKRCFIDISL
ncbi:MAG: hypothetical protein A2Y76_01145 [Planctomycetes bacterium RBG_13_60_9]|nr:MAG: hypothetical protein A2Y76_01145 [Planctomycetes bacterium RBG_13_60_9]